MKIIQYNAVTIDGFIATADGNSEWVSEADVEIFNNKIKEIGCVIMGSKTFQQYKGEYFPKKDALNIVVSKKSGQKEENGVVFVKSPVDVIDFAEKKNFKSALLIGGGSINGSFLKAGKIDEIFLDVHPLVFGSGVKLFENYESFISVELLEFKSLSGNQVLLHYKVIK